MTAGEIVSFELTLVDGTNWENRGAGIEGARGSVGG
jgi:hypothetical protein